MTCTRCGKSKEFYEFTKVNVNKNKTRALCRECKRITDAAHYKKKGKKEVKLEWFDLKPDMIKRQNRARVGVLLLDKIIDRESIKDSKYLGLKAILDELKEPYEYCLPEFMNKYEFVLCSLHSVMDVENLIYTIESKAPRPLTAKVVVGGFGVINIKLLVPYIDVACFGRAEGQINGILAGIRFQNVWYKENDLDITGKYVIRQAACLLPGEVSIGCQNKCRYCQYTHVRRVFGETKQYNPGMKTQETDWHSLVVDKPGHYNTAWDGWSENTRLRVHKAIRDEHLFNKLVHIGNSGFDKQVFLKIWQIVGYPWETQDTVLTDIQNTARLLKDVDKELKTKIYIGFVINPFGPEPMTDMQYDSADIVTPWRELVVGMRVCDGQHLKAVITPFIGGSNVLMKRVFIHRAEIQDVDRFKNIAFNSKLNRMKDKNKNLWLLEHGYINKEMFGTVKRASFDYLSVGGRGS